MTRLTHLVAVGVTALLPGVLAAQGIHDSVSVERRTDCRLAAQVLETGHPQPHYRWALRRIGACPDVAGPALAARWTAPPADTAEAVALVASSRDVRDQRILDAVLGGAADEARPTLARLSALRVLTSYADASAWVQLSDLYPTPSGITFIPQREDFFPRAGAVPLRADTPDRVVGVLHQLTGSPDPAVRRAAAYLAEGFRWRRRQHAP